jgi:hypothetical protein
LIVVALAVCAARAEQSVGLEAEGVDPSAALHNSLGLDVRDANGRPVSRELIEKQMAQSRQTAAVETAVFSGLPKLKKIIKLLALAVPLKAWFGAERRAVPLPGAWAMIPKKAEKDVVALPLLAVGLILSAGAACTRRSRTPTVSSAATPLALRC